MPGITWSYGITTVPQRANNLLATTVSSLAAAGFDSPHIFMDGLPTDEQSPKLENISGVVLRWPAVGHLRNWMGALFELYLANPSANRFAIFEDDLVACQNLRDYIERCPMPKRTYINLLTHDENLVGTGGVEGWHRSNQRGRGAVALVFDNKAVKLLLSHQDFIRRPQEIGKNAADGMVANILIPLDYEEYIHFPSLVQHIGGGRSTLGHKYGEVRAFFGENYNPLKLLGNPGKLDTT